MVCSPSPISAVLVCNVAMFTYAALKLYLMFRRVQEHADCVKEKDGQRPKKGDGEIVRRESTKQSFAQKISSQTSVQQLVTKSRSKYRKDQER